MERNSTELGKTVPSEPLNANSKLTTGDVTENHGLEGQEAIKADLNGRTSCRNGVCKVTWKPSKHAA